MTSSLKGVISGRREHVNNLQKQVDPIDSTVESQVKLAEELLAKNLQVQFTHELELKTEEHESTISLKEQSIT